MHLTVKKEATKPASATVLQQHARCDTFVAQFNRERPHQALDMNVPADVYTHSARFHRLRRTMTDSRDDYLVGNPT